MPYFALIYEVVDDFIDRRAPFRDEHLRLAAESHARGEIVLAGALAEPADAELIIFRCANLSTVEEFARRDLYVANSLVKKWTVRPSAVVVGQQPDPPPSLSGRLQ
jgi:uncharacterized protein YciI